MEYIDNSLSFFFPVTEKIPYPRDTQIELINKTVELINLGHKHIVVCAPTGSGKSAYGLHAARIIANYTQTNRGDGIIPKIVYTSPLNVLVDQLKDNYEDRYIKTLKGREHYECLAGKENCAMGFCKLKKCTLEHKRRIRIHRIDDKPIRSCKICADANYDLWSICPCNSCIYKREYDEFKRHPIGNTNFTLFQYGIADNRDIIIIDECDAIESFVRMQYSFTVDEYVEGEYSEHVNRLENIKIDTEAELELVEEGIIELELKEIQKLENRRDNIENLLEDYDHKIAWCFSYNKGKTKYEPIYTDRFIEPLLKDKIVIFMSATPQKIDGASYIEVKSTFPVENRPWEYIPIGKMGMKHREDTVHDVADFISKLRGKTLVHCHSYSIAKSLSDVLRQLTHNKVFLQVSDLVSENNNDNYYRKDIINQFKSSKDENAVLLSVNLARGVDFPELNIKNNVIAKFPWFDHTDPLTIAKNRQERNVKWQWDEISRTIMQAYGRLPRSPEKQSYCYIVDADFNNPAGRGMAKSWYDRHKEYFFDWFKDAEVRKLD